MTVPEFLKVTSGHKMRVHLTFKDSSVNKSFKDSLLKKTEITSANGTVSATCDKITNESFGTMPTYAFSYRGRNVIELYQGCSSITTEPSVGGAQLYTMEFENTPVLVELLS